MKLSRALIAPLAALALFSAHAADKLRIGVVPVSYTHLTLPTSDLV